MINEIIKFIGLDNWITILCSLFGLLGVYLTIQFTRKQFNEDKRIGIKPHLELKLKDKCCLGNYVYDKEFDVKFYNCNVYYVNRKQVIGNKMNISNFYIELDIENIGLGHALNLEIVNIYAEKVKITPKKNLTVIEKGKKLKIWLRVDKFILVEHMNLLDIVKNDSSERLKIIKNRFIDISFNTDSRVPTVVDKLKDTSKENIYIDIHYSDLLGNKYKKKFCLELYFDLYMSPKNDKYLIDGKVNILYEKNTEFLI